ncbi:hypothetical protein V5O48_003428 [Marasmius crinis-equi]|uniref:Uncharacterized protein n=1 Tax=Marasmius crinis-equi TaxID=585013 RepID=A0ABR3FSZ0_9AGAR
MVVLKHDANTDKGLPDPPRDMDQKMSKELEARREREETELTSPVEAPPPSYEAYINEPGPSRQPSTSQPPPFTFNRPSSSYHPPPFPQPQAQAPQLYLPQPQSPEPQSRPQPRSLPQSTSYSHLRHSTYTNASSAYSSTPALVPRSVELFTTASATPLPTNSLYAPSSTAGVSSTSVNTISPPKPMTSSSSSSSASNSSPSNSPHIPVPVFTPSAKKSLFSTQAGNKKRNAKEAKAFVQSQVRQMLQNQTNPQYTVDAYKSLFASCLEACTGNRLYLPSLLEEKFVDGRTPFYWAIVQRPFAQSPNMPDLLQALLMYGSPLVEETRKDIGQACLMVNDQRLFQALRVNDYFMGMGGQATSPESETRPIYKDRVMVEDRAANGPGGGDPEFAVTLEIPSYQKRPMIFVEFIAQRRLWRLTIRKPGAKNCKIALSLLEPSAASYVDSRFILQALNLPPSRSDSLSGSESTTSPPSSPRTSPRTEPTEEAAFSSHLRQQSSGDQSRPQTTHTYSRPPSEFVTALYSGYPPEKADWTPSPPGPSYQNQNHNPYSAPKPMSFYPDVVRGSSVDLTATNRERQDSSTFNGSNGYGSGSRQQSLASSESAEEQVKTSSGSDEFSLLLHEIPALPQEMVIKEVRLKSGSMLQPGKKEFEVEVPMEGVDILDAGMDEKTIRARFEARLAKPEKECVIC